MCLLANHFDSYYYFYLKIFGMFSSGLEGLKAQKYDERVVWQRHDSIYDVTRLWVLRAVWKTNRGRRFDKS